MFTRPGPRGRGCEKENLSTESFQLSSRKYIYYSILMWATECKTNIFEFFNEYEEKKT